MEHYAVMKMNAMSTHNNMDGFHNVECEKPGIKE